MPSLDHPTDGLKSVASADPILWASSATWAASLHPLLPIAMPMWTESGVVASLDEGW